MQTQEKKFSIGFIKYFSKLIWQMKGILFINFSIQKDFLKDVRAKIFLHIWFFSENFTIER